MCKKISEIKKELIPWIRHWDMLDDDEEPQPLPKNILNDLISLASKAPDNEPVLRELLTVQLLLGNHAAAVRILKQIIGLSGTKKPKQLIQDKKRLANLQKKHDEEPNSLLKMVGLSRLEFAALGRFIEKKSEEIGQISLSQYSLCREWVIEQCGGSEEDWDSLCSRFAGAGIFGDFGVREIYFERTPEKE